MILLIDNYDSFTYNLSQALEAMGQEVMVVRNDATDGDGLKGLEPSHLIISPGPATPKWPVISRKAIQIFSEKVPVLGVCLWHQTIGQCFEAGLVRAPQPIH